MVISEEDYIEHFGILGMHWGIRRGKRKTGISRFSSALIDKNAFTRRHLQRTASGKHVVLRLADADQRALVGDKNYASNLQARIAGLDQQDRRLKKGKATALDKLDMFDRVSPLELVFSIRPK
jgi:hypothetical protein